MFAHRLLDQDDAFQPFDDDYISVAMDRAYFILPKCTAVVSMIGSSIIIAEGIRDHQQKKGHALIRVLMMLSVGDLLSSLAWFLSSWPIPKEISYIQYNVGNTDTCTAQGFLLWFGTFGAMSSNVVLSWFYLLTIKYNFKANRLKKYEMYSYPSVWLFSFILSILPVFFDVYNPDYHLCSATAFPEGCSNESFSPEAAGDDHVPCQRGRNGRIWGIVLEMIIWVLILIVIIFLVLTFLAVRRTESRSAKKSIHGDLSITGSSSSSGGRLSGRRRQFALKSSSGNARAMWRTRLIRNQSLRYIGAFFLTYSLATIFTIVTLLGHWKYWFYYFEQIGFGLVTLQGFFNFVVFAWRRQMKTCIGKSLSSMVFCIPCRHRIKCERANRKDATATQECCNETVKDPGAEQPANVPTFDNEVIVANNLDENNNDESQLAGDIDEIMVSHLNNTSEENKDHVVEEMIEDDQDMGRDTPNAPLENEMGIHISRNEIAPVDDMHEREASRKEAGDY